MSKLVASDYDNVLDLIDAVGMTGSVPGVTKLKCAVACGYNVTDIIASVRLNFPDNTMTDDQIANLLSRATKNGVFNVVCSTAVSSDLSECDLTGVGQPLYRVNQSMVKVNGANKVYADAFNARYATTPIPDPLVNPYYDANIACVAANTAGIGGLSGTVGNC
jgi:hypothetical protein